MPKNKYSIHTVLFLFTVVTVFALVKCQPPSTIWVQSDSPCGVFRVTVYIYSSSGFSFPGHGSDKPGYCEVVNRKKQKNIFKAKIDIVNTIDTVTWTPKEVTIGKNISVSLPQEYIDSTKYSHYFQNERILEAIKYSDTTEIKKVLDAGGELNVTENYNNTPLYIAALNNDTLIVRWLLMQGGFLARLNSVKNGILADQLIQKNSSMMVFLIKAGVDPEIPNIYGIKPLGAAIQLGNVDAIRVLLESGVKPDPDSPEMNKLLDTADSSVIKILLKYK